MSEQPTASPPLPPATSSPKKGRWRRRIVRLVIVAVVLLLGLRAAVSIALPTVLRRVANFYGLNCEYQRSQISLLGGHAELWHLKLTPQHGGEPLVQTEYVRGNLSPLNLLRGRLVVWRAEADGVDLLINLDDKDDISLLKRVATQAATEGLTIPAPAGDHRSIDLTSPMRLDAFRLSHVKARLRNQSVDPPLDTVVDLNLRVSDVGAPDRPMRFQLALTSNPLVDLLVVTGEAKFQGKDLDSTMSVRLRGVRPFGLRDQKSDVSISCVARIKTTATSTPADALTGSATIETLAATVDGREELGVDRISLDITSLDLASAKLASLLVDGVRCRGSRDEQGRLTIAGIELPADAPAPTVHGMGAPSAPPVTQPAQRAYSIELDQLAVRKIRAKFDDAYISPATQVVFESGELSAKRRPNGDGLSLSGDFTMPGLVRSGTIDGTLAVLARDKSLAMSIRMNGLVPEVLKPYLHALGVECILNDASVVCDFDAQVGPRPDGRVGAEATLRQLSLTDGTDLLRLEDARIRGIKLDPESGFVQIEAIELAGPNVAVRRDASGRISTLGFRNLAEADGESRPSPSTAPVAPQSKLALTSLPRLQIDRFSWKDIKIRFDDESVAPPVSLALSDAGVELTNLNLDLQSAGAASAPGTVRAWLAAPGMIERASIEGSILSGGGSIAVDARVGAWGVNAIPLQPYLAASGIQPTLRDGTLDMQTSLSLSQLDGGMGAMFALSKLRFADGEDELAGIESLKMDGIELREAEISVASLRIDQPRAKAGRDAAGALELAGVRVLPSAGGPDAYFHSEGATSSMQRLSAPIAVDLKEIGIHNATLLLSDRAVSPNVDTTARANVQLNNLVLGRAAAPATVQVDLSASGIVDEATVRGSILAGPSDVGARLEISAAGVHGASLSGYLPHGTELALRDGTFRTDVEAHAGTHADGGWRGQGAVSNLNLTDAGESLFKVGNLTLNIARWDPAGEVVAIEEISSKGLETDVRLEPGGAVRLAGLVVAAAPPSQAIPAAATTQPGAAPTTQNVARKAADALAPFPLVSVEKLDLNVARVALTDASRPQGAPIVFKDLRIHNPRRIELGGAKAQELPPVEIVTSCALEPVIGSISLKSQLAPLAQQPGAVFELEMAGIRGDGLTAVVPEVAPRVDGSAMTDGRFSARLQTSFNIDRRTWQDLDFSRPFDLDLHLKEVALRAAPDGPPVAGVQDVQMERARINPGSGAIHVRTLEINKPIARITRQPDGIHAFGLVIRVEPAPAEHPSTETTPPQVEASLASARQPPARPDAEIRIDRLLISGIDVLIEDHAVDPPLALPLDSLDAEVRNLSNMALYEDRPLRFSALLTSGKTALPAKSSAASEREVFAQVAASGKVSLYPEPNGWIKTSVNGFELAALQGAAKQADVNLNGGIFDSAVDLRLPGDGTIKARSKLTLTDLDVSEPDNGLIHQTLKLPSPLNVVIDAVEDPDGSINVPIGVTLKDGELSRGQIAGAAIGALGSVLATAVASAPVKAIGAVGGIMGVGGEKQRKAPDPVEISFDAGDAALSASQNDAIQSVLRQMARDRRMELTLRHEVSTQDIERVAIRANPSQADSASLAYQLRSRKLELQRQRSDLAGQARGELISPGAAAFGTIERLRQVDRELALTEDALDRVYDLMRPGADRQASRRTRAATIELAQQRLLATRAALLAGSVDLRDRIRLVNPQAAAAEGAASGRVVITLVPMKKK